MVEPLLLSARGSLADVAYEQMLEWIMDGTLTAGESIPLAQLAQNLKISQTPLRESLARLEGQGLVVRLPMRGFKVAEPLSGADLDALMQARLILEPAIAARAASAATPETASRLREVWEQSAAVDIGPKFEGYRGYLERSAEFHDLISVIAGNRFLREAANALPIHVQRFRLFGDEGVTDRDVALKEHKLILEAIVAGDPVAASHQMENHIQAVHERSSTTGNASD